MGLIFRTPNLKKSIAARTTGKWKRAAKKKLIPGYGQKGTGFLKNPKKALYNYGYSRTTVGLSPSAVNTSKRKRSESSSINNVQEKPIYYDESKYISITNQYLKTLDAVSSALSEKMLNDFTRTPADIFTYADIENRAVNRLVQIESEATNRLLELDSSELYYKYVKEISQAYHDGCKKLSHAYDILCSKLRYPKHEFIDWKGKGDIATLRVSSSMNDEEKQLFYKIKNEAKEKEVNALKEELDNLLKEYEDKYEYLIKKVLENYSDENLENIHSEDELYKIRENDYRLLDSVIDDGHSRVMDIALKYYYSNMADKYWNKLYKMSRSYINTLYKRYDICEKIISKRAN